MSKGKRYDEPKLNLKKVFAVIILFVVIIMCIVMLKGILAGEEEKQENITSIDYFVAYNNNKWGVINSNGDIVIDPSYAEMIIVPNSKKDIFLCTFDVNYDDGTYKTKALNSKNEEILTSYEQIEAITNIDENQNLSYNGQVLRVQKQGKYGLINMDGTEILPCEYEEIKALQGVENAILLQKEGKYGIVNNEGKTLIEPNYVEIQGLGKEASQGFIVKNQEEKYGIIDISNKQVLETKYDAISKIHKGDYYVVTENGKQKVVKKDGTEILNGEYDEIVAILKNPENGIIYKDNEKYGLMNLEGTKIIAENYDDLKEAKTGTFIVKQKDNYGIIDQEGKTLVEVKYKGINYNEKADIYITEDENYNNEILNGNYEIKLTGMVTNIDDERGYIEIKQEEGYKYYNFKFEEQKEADIFKTNTLFVSKKDGKYGFLDKDGNVVVDYIYDDATMQNTYGYAGIKKDGKWGVVDRNGKVIQEPTYKLDDYLQIDFIGRWYLGKDLNMNYYRK